MFSGLYSSTDPQSRKMSGLRKESINSLDWDYDEGKMFYKFWIYES